MSVVSKIMTTPASQILQLAWDPYRSSALSRRCHSQQGLWSSLKVSFDEYIHTLGCRVLARISKMPVQNSNFKISARPDLAINLLQILIPATINSLVCQKGQFTLQLCPRRWFVTKIFGYYTPKIKTEKSS